jgi:hypothetical protein
MEPGDIPPPEHRHARYHRVMGSSRQALGWLTADRHVEAAGEAEHQLLERPPPDVIAEVEHLVHVRYHEAMPRPDATGRY